MSASAASPTTPEDVVLAVRAGRRLVPRGGGTKTALSRLPEGASALDLRGLRGVLEYEPREFTVTALAGTPLGEVVDLLGRNGQSLPFDPPFARQGATVGGAVAAGLSGPGRLRFGGVRDFIIGVRFVDGEGALVRGGGKVVKNAAGFDLPKLLAGSLGALGAIVELSFKVFPRPAACATVRFRCATLDRALAAMRRLASSPAELLSLELEPPGVLVARLGGSADALAARAARLRMDVEEIADALGATETGEGEEEYWSAARDLSWRPSRSWLVKVPLTPSRLAALDAELSAELGARPIARRYSVAGQLAWIAWPDGRGVGELEAILVRQGLQGLVVLAPEGEGPGRDVSPLLNYPPQAFAGRVRAALDPRGVFAARWGEVG